MDEPIAIIGLDARLPGDGDTAERFYESLLAGRSARTEVPPERFNIDSFWHPDGERSGSGSISAFDAPFFSITPAEANGMDPQQRGMLESVYKALENAGLPIPAAAGTQTGVYVGCFAYDYNDIIVKDFDVPSKYAATGTVASMLSNRVSWFFDFRGPSITVDTACSSSLVAAHEACMSLKLREIDMAVVGGCNLILSPEMTLKLDAAGVLGPDGKSYSFDHRGNGYARGEGFGTLVMKRVSDAIRDGDVIRAVIRNSSTNQDGRSPGITQPTKAGQAALIRHVYKRAGLDPSLTRFFEAHGTGTQVGDPIEASAIAEIFAPHRSPDNPLYVGALKSNVGHLEGAAGVAALIKGVFTLERGIIPPNIWLEKVNPKIKDSWHLKFPTEATPWPQEGLRRMSINSFGIGGSNAHVVMDDAVHFLQQYRLVGAHRTVTRPISSPRSPVANGHGNGNGNGGHRRVDSGIDLSEDIETTPAQLFVLSAYDQEGISRVSDLYDSYLSTKSKNTSGEVDEVKDAQFLRDLGHTLATKRTHHAWRAFAVADSPAALRNGLSELPRPTRIKSEPRLAWVFTGQGAQWPAMGIELMAYPVFQQSILAADRYLNDLDELSKNGGSSRIDDPEFCQPICTALQVALVDLLTSWNVFPHAVTGHSSGEVAAAYATGALSREAAWKVAYYRGKLSSKLIRSGTLPKTGMAAVGLDMRETWAAIERVNQMGGQGSLDIACMNSWQSHTVSGDAGKIDALVDMLTAEKVFARKLNVEIAYHSVYMKAMADEYLESMGDLQSGVSPTTFKATFFSSTRGSSISPSELRKPSYWVANLVSPVRFCESATAMLKGSVDEPKVDGDHNNGSSPSTPITDVLEIGPHSALKGPLANISKQASGGETVMYHSVLRRKSSAVQTALEAAGSLFCQGYGVDLAAVNDAAGFSNHKPLMLIDLPSYPFNHSKEYWTEGRLSKNFRLRSAGRHELLGAPIADWNKNNAIWRNYIRLSESPWVEDHKVAGDVLYPAAGMLVMAIEASRQVAEKDKILKGFRFKDVSFHEALQVPDDSQGIESHFYLRPYRETSLPGTSAWNEFQLWTFNNEEWREHCRGLVQTEYEEGQSYGDRKIQERCSQTLKDAQNACTSKVAVEKLYRNFKDSGLDFGPTFRTLSDVRTGSGLQLLADVDSPLAKIREAMPSHYVQPHLVHPAMLDGVVHANLAPLVSSSRSAQQPRVPVYAKEIWVSASPSSAHDAYTVSAQSSRRGRTETESSVTAVDRDTGVPMVYASGLVFKTLPGGASQDPASLLHDSFNVEWNPDPTLLSKSQASEVFGLSMSAEDNPSSWMEDCEALCLAYIRRFLGSVTKDRIERMDEHHLKYVTWMEHVSRNANEVATCDIEELEAKVEAKGTPEGVLIIAVGQALDEMLGGPLNPLDVIFKDKIAENVYRYGLGCQRCYEQLCNYMDALAHKDPAMQILEIGAGTGGATRSVMQTLAKKGQRYQKYCFTDISPSFFEQAREIFSDELGNMDFRVLNIENDPLEQGFEAGRYDLVVAANVLHATKKIDVSLSNVKKLLRPGGKLLLFEITNIEVLLSHFCFGVLPGWWLSEDKDRRWGPLMSASGWDYHLSQSGFTGLDMAFQDFPGSDHQMSSILVSTVPEEQKVSETTAMTYLIVDDMPAQQDDVAQQLASVLSKEKSARCEIVPLAGLGAQELQLTTCIVLAELRSTLLQTMTESVFNAIKGMTSKCQSLLWVTRGGNASASDPDAELVSGLARVARSERPDFKFITVSFEQNESSSTIIEKCIQMLMTAQDGNENSFRVAGGITQIPRLVKADYLREHIRSQTASLDVVRKRLGKEASRALVLQVGTPGQLDTLRFEDDALYSTPLARDEVEFRAVACGLNPIDVASALGKIEGSPVGFEASGIVTRVGPASKFEVGDHVFGLSFTGAVKTLVRSEDGFLAKMPECLSWAEAASIPVAYTTAYAVFHDSGTIRKGDTVLVHSAATSLGQAAVQLAQLAGAEVFATVEDDDKRHFIETTYAISRDHVSLTKPGAFKIDIQQMTKGRGVDIVLNFLGGEMFTDTLACVAPFGRLVDIHSGDTSSDPRISLGDLQRRNIRYETFDLRYRGLNDPVRTQRSFRGTIEQLLLRRPGSTIQRTTISTYPFSQVQDVFRQLQSGGHIEKLVLEAHDEDEVLVLPRREPACQFDHNATYVIAGGLGGLGRSVARWMASRGARNLILLSRRGPVQAAAKELVKELEGTCERVATPACDVTDNASLREVINKCLKTMPPVRGCIQGSMVLKDNHLGNMTLSEWNDAVLPKVAASRNLFDNLGRDLDFFILLSSTVGITGGPEQANYAAGNTYQDALARHLASQGVHAVSLDLPIICGVGYVEERRGLLDHLRSMGWAFMEEKEFHATLDYHCRPPPPDTPSPAPVTRSQVLPRFWLPQQTAAEGRELPPWRLDPLFSQLAVSSATKATGENKADATKTVNHAALLAAATSPEEAVKVALEALLLKISRVLSVDVSNLDPAKPLHAYGVDSLVAVELRSWLAKELKAEVSVFDMTNASSISQVASTAMVRSKLVGEELTGSKTLR
ncbi:Lovastatin diketide synthase LovF [Cytospora mali]|uniref:Lovastatin diketide synthase LovF n=1 Tax=Cytospora mali TaxID=578113 RepID=A0A194UX07_CYTMA|nr:Lovastatin diketide synthase LovF [Valsa mali var. pyri (nom. inval.)]